MRPFIREKLDELIEVSSRNGLTEVLWQEKEFKVAFRRSPVRSVVQPMTVTESSTISEESKSQEILVYSPMVGTFRRSIDKTRPPLVMEGDHVKPGDRLGIVECMKIPTDVSSISEGKIAKIFVTDGQVVEYGQKLFAIIPSLDESQNELGGQNHV